MKREFLINMAFLLGINLLIKPFYIFGIDRGVQNIVGAENYGLYLSLFNFAFILGILNDLGIQNFNNRHISQHRHLVVKYVSSLFSLKLLLSALFLIVLFLGGLLLGYSVNFPQLLFFIGVNQILSSFSLYLRTNASGLGYYRWDSFFSILDRLFLIGIVGYLLWLSPERAAFKIEWFVWSQTASLTLTSLILFTFLRPKLQGWKLRFNRLKFLALLRQSLPFALVILLMTMYTRVDVVMLEQLLENGAREAGIYGGAYRILDAANMLGFLVAGLLLPMFSRQLKTKESVVPLLQLSFRILMTAAILLSSASWFFRSEIMQLLYWEATPYWGSVLGVLMISYLALCGTYIHGSLLTANGQLRSMNLLFAGAILLNIIGNYFLIPHYGAVGAAAMTVVTQTLAWLGQWGLVQKDMHVGIDGSTLIRLLGLLLILVGIGLFALPALVASIGWLPALLSYLAAGGCSAAFLKLIPLRELTQNYSR
ncbi:MAG: oligosaccharide flippase family protein [Saprospiraceae bacterium]|nr:oligosaccharide flippase family protein [Saprospiraceae bacterium]